MWALLLALCLATVAPDVRAGQSGNARDRAAALAATADAHASAGRLAEAILAMEEAERMAPAWAELKVNLAALRSEAGDYAGAMAAARHALRLDSTLEGAWVNLGLAELKSGDAPAAAKTLSRYKGRKDAPKAARAALGVALLLVGDAADAAHDWPGAEAAYRDAMAADPAVPRGHYSLGLVLYKQRRYDEAASHLDRELATDPTYHPALQYRAELELDRGNAAAALPLLERLTTVAPESGEGWRALGRARIDLGLGEGAVTALRRAVELTPDDPSAAFLLGRALMLAGRAAEAKAAFARATELNQRVRDELQRRISGKKKGGG